MRNRQLLMRNRQRNIFAMLNSFSPRYSAKTLAKTLSDAGFNDAVIINSSPTGDTILNGNVHFNTLASGINIHQTDVTEEFSGKHTVQVSGGISVNYLLQGKVSFSINDQRYTIDATNGPTAFVITMQDQAIFTRFFEQGQYLKKLNLTVDRAWIEKRCQSTNDRNTLKQLFCQSHHLYQWHCEQDDLILCEQLLVAQQTKALTATMTSEHIAFQLFNRCYQKLQTLMTEDNKAWCKNNPTTVSYRLTDKHFENEIEKLLQEPLTLNDIANKLGASVSTLQRYFKQKYRMTLKEYIRHKKLEKAKNSLVVDNKTIGEVAFVAGYNHTSNFITAFIKHFNISPTELKKKHALKS